MYRKTKIKLLQVMRISPRPYLVHQQLLVRLPRKHNDAEMMALHLLMAHNFHPREEIAPTAFFPFNTYAGSNRVNS